LPFSPIELLLLRVQAPGKAATMTTNVASEQALQSWLAEYQSLRTEIEWLIEGGVKYQNFAITLLGILFTAIAWAIQHAPRLLVPTLLAIPFLFTLLGFLYCRQHEEVYVVAAYLKDYVRPRVRRLVDDEAMWGWEEFKAERNAQWSKSKSGRASSAGIVFALRSMLFIAPSVGSMIAVAVHASSQQLISFHLLKHFVPAVFAAWFVFNAYIVAALGLYLFKRMDLQKRIVGDPSQPPPGSHSNQEQPRPSHDHSAHETGPGRKH
jgi:hypothetical protein